MRERCGILLLTKKSGILLLAIFHALIGLIDDHRVRPQRKTNALMNYSIAVAGATDFVPSERPCQNCSLFLFHVFFVFKIFEYINARLELDSRFVCFVLINRGQGEELQKDVVYQTTGILTISC